MGRAFLSLLVACNSDGAALSPDANRTDAAAISDTPFSCTPVAPRAPAAACLALDASSLRGATPFGAVDVALEYFGAGDCLTISAAHVAWRGACGETLRLQFSYPVVETGSGRRVTGSFDVDAWFDFQPPDAATRGDPAAIHVDVAQWQEGQGVHDIDITLTVTDAAYAIPPFRVHGTFCDWPYYLC
jgi:hypothetical protein